MFSDNPTTALPGTAASRRRATVIVEWDGALLLTVSRKGLVLLPGGGIEPGETPQDAARRELLEETGLHTSALQLMFTHLGQRNHHWVFLATAHGRPAPGDDAHGLLWCREPWPDTGLNLSFDTVAILSRYESLSLET